MLLPSTWSQSPWTPRCLLCTSVSSGHNRRTARAVMVPSAVIFRVALKDPESNSDMALTETGLQQSDILNFWFYC